MLKNLVLAGLFCIFSFSLSPADATAQVPPANASQAQAMPAELVRFKDRYEAVMAKKDLDALAKMIAPGFLHNGRNKEGMMDNFRWFTPMINSYKMDIASFKREGELLVVDYKIHTDLATTEHSVAFKSINGELHFYGNQRRMNADGSLSEASKRN